MCSKNLDDEYMLAEVSKVMISDECFTLNTPPRVTQPTVGQYLIRKDGKSDFINQKIEVHPKILDSWANKNRGYWVDKCGTNDYYIHELVKKYNFKTKNYSPMNTPFKRLIPRPYSCELDCVNARRLSGMKDIENKYRSAVLKLTAKEMKREKICEFLPPFWWEHDKTETLKFDPCKKEVPELKQEMEKKQRRWRPVPSLVAAKERTICQRRDEMNQVGQSYYHEACTFYNKHYPAAKLTILPFSFIK